MEQRDQMESKLEGMRQKLAIMEWDKGRDQLNPAIRMKLDKLKEECAKLEQELKQIQELKQAQ
jgi:hypothetical protein